MPPTPAAAFPAMEPILDRAFLDAQCFGDRELEREVLLLFLGGGAGLVAALPALDPGRLREAAHRLKGSCLGIGARAAARAAQALEEAGLAERDGAATALARTFAATETVIRELLAAG